MDDKTKSRLTYPFVGSDLSDSEFDEVRLLLLEKKGFDLGMYKDRCIRRRIASRIRALGYRTAGPYLLFLEESPDEAQELIRALSVHVSHFFRNPSTFNTLEYRIFPELVERARNEGREVRIWSAGCATGEEPYSLAILIDNIPEIRDPFSILATDLSPSVIDQAREGLFPPNRLEEVPKDILERYFEKEGVNYRLSERVRRKVRFEVHDILSADNYPTCDLVLCRNVLIYFSREDQERIIEGFAAALSQGGYLVLGKAETLQGRSRELFTSEFAVERIYRRKLEFVQERKND